jgi:lipoate-protein ligase A
MALDEAVFRSSHVGGIPPTLRFYCWAPPAVSLGYFQNTEKEIDIEACRKCGIDIVRRPTGGKAVLHGQDLAYSVVAKETNPLFPKDILGTYQIISQCIAEGLSSLGIDAAMFAGMRDTGDALKAFCFSEPSRYELLVKGKKICGSAQARSHGAFLQHGSLLMDFDPAQDTLVIRSHPDSRRQSEQLRKTVTSIREHNDQVNTATLCHALKTGFENVLGIHFIEDDLSPLEDRLKSELLANKYMSPNWNLDGKQ